MIPLDEARAHVLTRCAPLEPTEVTLADALGLVTASDLTAREPIPPFDNTAMDGFAVRAADTVGATAAGPVTLEVVGTLPAGAAPTTAVGAGQAIRIMTGAPMPPGADAVVMVELTAASPDGNRVEVQAEVPFANHVRPAGDDLSPGDAVFAAGTVLTAGHLGVLASVGEETVRIFPPARVGVVSTGDELVDGARALAPGQIRDSNRQTLLALLAEAGCEPIDLGLVRDNEIAITHVLTQGASFCDAVITSGGVSMGDFDYVKTVLDRIGDMRWMQVAIRPAKPLAFGTVDGTPVFGLPGNPVSSMVSFELFARPGLRKMMGHTILDRPRLHAISDEGIRRSPDGKLHLARVVARYEADGYHVRSAGGQGSHQLAAMANANALALVPDGDGIEPGAMVDFFLLR